MKSKVLVCLCLVSLALVWSSGCQSEEVVVTRVVTETVEVEGEAVEVTRVVEAAEVEEIEVDADTAVAAGSQNLTLTQAGRSQRLIIKDAEIKLLVADPDVAIDRTTQIVGDVGGYIVSSRVWYEPWGEENVKYSTLTIGVPSDQFEVTLRRLRDIAVRVLDENASGQDVTDEFVDLQSRLENLKATRDRLRTFLEEAENVEEALQVNEELSRVEGQIEEVQGRVNYLSDRAAFSTITITLEPELGDRPTPTPHPTSTPRPWNPSATYGEARATLVNTYRGVLDAAIWFGVAIIPTLVPVALIGWVVWRAARRKPTGVSTPESEHTIREERDNE